MIDINDIDMEIELSSEKCELRCEATVITADLDDACALIAIAGDEIQNVVLELLRRVGMPIDTVKRRPQFVQRS